MAEKLFEVLDNDIALAICGPFNTNISHMEKTLGSAIICRGTTFKVTGDDENVNNTISALTAMEDLHKRGTDLDEQAVRYCVSLAFYRFQDHWLHWPVDQSRTKEPFSLLLVGLQLNSLR